MSNIKSRPQLWSTFDYCLNLSYYPKFNILKLSIHLHHHYK